MFGWRGRVGYISTERIQRGAYEFYKIVPEGVSLIMTCLPKGAADKARLKEVTEQLSAGGINCLLFSCTPRVVREEYGPEDELIRLLEEISGKPATTTTSAAVEAMKSINIKKVLLSSPFNEQFTKEIAGYLTKCGFEVVCAKFMKNIESIKREIANTFCVTQPNNTYLPDNLFFNSTKEAFCELQAEVDGIYSPCTQWVTDKMVTLLEEDLGKPVVVSNNSTIWWALRKLKVNVPITGHGKLLESM